MTPALRPDSALAGDWRDASVQFLIHDDASVTGSIGADPIAGARITYGRSWFGALLHWNSPYRITGVLSGEPFSAPLDARGDSLDGALFLQRRPRHIVLTKQIN